MSLFDQIDKDRLPQHVAIIMDGNGRWAKARGKERSFGHQEGVVSLRKVVTAARKLGLKFLTLYAFSMENWKKLEKKVTRGYWIMVAIPILCLVGVLLLRHIGDILAWF